MQRYPRQHHSHYHNHRHFHIHRLHPAQVIHPDFLPVRRMQSHPPKDSSGGGALLGAVGLLLLGALVVSALSAPTKPKQLTEKSEG